MNPPEPTPAGGAISGSLKVIAALAVLALATLAGLLVLNVIEQDMFQNLATKIGLLLLIAAAASVALGVLSKSRR
jgi:uncharacterized membrane protein YdfJ with MMPL/SSD domain